MVDQNHLPSSSYLYLKHPLYTPIDLSYLGSTEQAEYVQGIEYPEETMTNRIYCCSSCNHSECMDNR